MSLRGQSERVPVRSFGSVEATRICGITVRSMTVAVESIVESNSNNPAHRMSGPSGRSVPHRESRESSDDVRRVDRELHFLEANATKDPAEVSLGTFLLSRAAKGPSPVSGAKTAKERVRRAFAVCVRARYSSTAHTRLVIHATCTRFRLRVNRATNSSIQHSFCIKRRS